MERNAHRLLRQVADLLFLSQIHAGKASLEFAAADLASIAAQAVEEMRPEAQRKHIDLVLSAAEVPRLAMDPMRVAQLLGNLLSNAVKFTPEGGRVEVRLAAEDGQAVLAVTDTGMGIPGPELECIFERFARSSAARQQAIPGTGIGLTISKAIVDAHHGALTVDSREGQGSTFPVRFPIRPAGLS